MKSGKIVYPRKKRLKENARKVGDNREVDQG
jgi:hypothetical protein